MTARPTDTHTLGERNSWCSVYDGQRCLGHIVSRGRDGIEAFDTNDRSLGIFGSQREAAAALPIGKVPGK